MRYASSPTGFGSTDVTVSGAQVEGAASAATTEELGGGEERRAVPRRGGVVATIAVSSS